MKTIPLSTGGFAIVDDEDFEKVCNRTWWECDGYAVTALPREGRKNSPLVQMQVFLLGTRRGEEIDHRDRNRLNNRRRTNLRFVTHSFNLANRPKPRGEYLSEFKGVSWHTPRQKWRAYIKVNYRQIHLGLFDSEWAAARAYNRAALKHFGESACLNTL